MTQVFGRATTRLSVVPAKNHRSTSARRRLSATTVVLTLLVAGLSGPQSAQAAVAKAPVLAATAAVHSTTAKTSPRATIKLTRSASKQIFRTTAVRLVAKVSVSHHQATGRVTFSTGNRTLAIRKVKHGKAELKLSKYMRVGKHRIVAKYTPTATTGAAPVTAASKIRVISQYQAIVATAKKYTGTPYRSGGKTPKGFDCSGFTRYVYDKAVGKSLSPSSSAQRHAGRTVSRKQAKPGDIIWSPGHVAIYLGGNKQIDAPRPGKTIQVREMFQSNPTFIRVV